MAKLRKYLTGREMLYSCEGTRAFVEEDGIERPIMRDGAPMDGLDKSWWDYLDTHEGEEDGNYFYEGEVYVHTQTEATEEHTGGSSNYYKIEVVNPTTGPVPYMAECNDIIEALDMNFAEGNAFKAIWRIAAARKGKRKKGNNAVYDAEKIVFFADRILIQQKQLLSLDTEG